MAASENATADKGDGGQRRARRSLRPSRNGSSTRPTQNHALHDNNTHLLMMCRPLLLVLGGAVAVLAQQDSAAPGASCATDAECAQSDPYCRGECGNGACMVMCQSAGNETNPWDKSVGRIRDT